MKVSADPEQPAGAEEYFNALQGLKPKQNAPGKKHGRAVRAKARKSQLHGSKLDGGGDIIKA